MKKLPKKNLLIIEDDEDTCDMLQEIATAVGFDAYKAYDGTSGLRAASIVKYDGIILDLVLPGVSGVEIASVLKFGINSETPIFVYSGGVDGKVLETLKLIKNVAMIVEKPSRPDAFLKSVAIFTSKPVA
jgi:DNA-binding response OmpR family regulator